MSERFRMVSTTGVSINPASLAGSNTGAHLGASYAVLDSGNAYRIVGEYLPQAGGGGRHPEWCERHARRLAEMLNAWDAAVVSGSSDAADLLAAAKEFLRGRIVTLSTGVCKACGVPRDERTPGCIRCNNRHNKRSQKAYGA